MRALVVISNAESLPDKGMVVINSTPELTGAVDFWLPVIPAIGVLWEF